VNLNKVGLILVLISSLLNINCGKNNSLEDMSPTIEQSNETSRFANGSNSESQQTYLIKFTNTSALKIWLNSSFGIKAKADEVIQEVRNDNSVLLRTSAHRLQLYKRSTDITYLFNRPPQFVGNDLVVSIPAVYDTPELSEGSLANSPYKIGVKLNIQDYQKLGSSARRGRPALNLTKNELYQLRTLAMGNSNSLSHADNSINRNFPPVGNQQYAGSCTTWAMGYYGNTYSQNQNLEFATTPGASIGGRNYQQACSPAFIYPLISGGEDSGSESSIIFSAMSQYGCASLSEVPYVTTGSMNWDELKDWLRTVTTKWYNVGIRDRALDNRLNENKIFQSKGALNDLDIETIKNHLANGLIGYVTFFVFDSFTSYPDAIKVNPITSATINFAGEFNNNVYYDNIPSADNMLRGGHAVTIVGYDDNKSYTTPSGIKRKGAFLFVNSWGHSWGIQNPTLCPDNNCDPNKFERGYFWVSYELLQKYLLNRDGDLNGGILGDIYFLKNQYDKNLGQKHILSMVINPLKDDTFGYNTIPFYVNGNRKVAGIPDILSSIPMTQLATLQANKPIVLDITENYQHASIQIDYGQISSVQFINYKSQNGATPGIKYLPDPVTQYFNFNW
jgi:hypothetical protein